MTFPTVCRDYTYGLTDNFPEACGEKEKVYDQGAAV
jgi:hypothetical protein